MDWKIIQGHRWPDSLYVLGLEYLKTNTVPEEKKEKMSEKQLKLFKRRMRHYTIHEDTLAVVEHSIPRWLVRDRVPLSAYKGEFPVVYKVVRESEITPILETYLKDPALTGFSRDALYDKVVRDKLVGISKSDIVSFLKQTDIVQKLRHEFKAPVVKSYRPMFPFEHWQMDLIDMSREDLRIANKSYTWIFVVIDIFSKFLYLYPIVNKEPNTVSAVLEKVFLSGDIPKKLQHDDGGEFKGAVTSLLKSFGVQNIENPAYSPKTNGFVENKNRQIKSMLHSYMVSRKTKVYYDVLGRVSFNINNTKHSVTNMTPFQVHRGVDAVFTVKGLDVTIGAPYPDWPYSATRRDVVTRQPGQDAVDECDVKNIKQYAENAKKLYERRTSLVRGIIHKTADKRESRDAMFDAQLVVGDSVHVGQKQSMNPGKKLVRIQLRDEDGVVAFEYGEGIVPKTVHFQKKMMATMYPEEFKIEQIVRDGNKPFYVLYTTHDNKRLYAYQYVGGNVFSKRFYRSQLYLIRNKETEHIKRPNGGYRFYDPLMGAQDVVNKGKLPLVENQQMMMEVGMNGKKTAAPKDLSKAASVQIVRVLQDEDMIRRLASDESTRVYVDYVFTIDDAITRLQTERGYLNAYFKPGDTVSKKMIENLQLNYMITSPIKKHSWHIKFPDDPSFYVLELDPKKYLSMNTQNGWKFSDPRKVHAQFLA